MNQLLKYILLSLFALFFGQNIIAQTIDATKIFSESAYFEWVRKYHPVIRQAQLLNRVGDAYTLKARGGFDPKFFGAIQQKSFDGKRYFTVGETGLKIPSWLGAEFKAGYNWTNGVFLNPENNLPAAGQAYAGVKWSLGKGLRIDERRATLEKAKIVQTVNQVEQQAIINDLLLDAGKAYWNWVNAYNDLKIYEAALQLAKVRLEGVKSSYLQGDKPAIDTLESTIQVQNRQILVNDAAVVYENSRRYLSNFLWYENELPLEVSPLLRPISYERISLPAAVIDLEMTLTELNDRHPILRQYELKLRQLAINRRLKKEQLKPQIDLEFNFLSDGIDFVNRPKDANEMGALDALFTENYKAGIKVGMPLFRRKERADLELADLKLLDTNYKLQQKRQAIKNKVLNYQDLLDNSRRQVGINQLTVTNYQSLLAAENEKFRFGESSIFLLNSREQKLIAAQLKLVKLLTLYQKNRLALGWAAGQLE
ncbi:MAG: TolC family protein [Saprospiraceae bacterium]